MQQMQKLINFKKGFGQGGGRPKSSHSLMKFSEHDPDAYLQEMSISAKPDCDSDSDPDLDQI